MRIAQFEFTELDEMTLVYRFVLRGETFTALGADYHLDDTTVGLHIHNHIWAFALLWGCRYVYPLQCSDITQMTPAKFKKLLPARCFALAGDCTEMSIDAFYSTALSKLLFSGKAGYNSVKLWLGCTLSGWIAMSSDIYGGGSTEVAPLHGVMRSAVFKELMANAKEVGMKLVLFEDRGFRDLCVPPEYSELVEHIFPPFLEDQPQFEAEDVVFARVRLLHAFPTRADPWQILGAVRYIIECVNQVLKVMTAVDTPPVAIRPILDPVKDVAVARNNYKVGCRLFGETWARPYTRDLYPLMLSRVQQYLLLFSQDVCSSYVYPSACRSF
jgi:hypothetical protein